MRRGARILGLASLSASLALGAALVRAQFDDEELEDVEQDDGAPLGADFGQELDAEHALREAQQGRNIRAREIAERLIARDPNDYRANFVLGFVYHYGEANFARALYYQNRAFAELVRLHGRAPEDPAVRVWHFRMLRELAWTHGDLEHYDEQLRYMAEFSDVYEPPFVAERAWPLMKLRRFDDARRAAEAGRLTGQSHQVVLALNALCAIEFEAGDEQRSYESCREAMELGGGDPTRQGAVDFTNFAEAARSVFRLDEAERVGRLAVQAQVSWYGNPHSELAELYLRQGRFAEALNSLREVPGYRERRPPHVRDADRSETRRALASFFLLVGRPDDAHRYAQKALDAPDRRAHNSRDPRQDRAIAALLHRSALRLRAERRAEAAVGAPFYERLWAWGEGLGDRWAAWLSGRVAARAIADDHRLIGTFQIGTHRAAVMPPWLVGELVDVLGAGVAREAIRRAREEDEREGSDAYYDAFDAEAALAAGDPARARELAARAIADLNPAEAVLRARVLAILAEAARRQGDARAASDAYGEAFQVDPGVFRRFGWPVPVRYDLSGGLAEDVAGYVASGARFDTEDWGLTVQIRADRARGQACLLDPGGSVLGCAEATASAEGEDADAFAARVARELFDAAFAPRVALSQADANGLDGSNRVSRDPLRTMFDHAPPPRD
ncbi:MAG: hypothetical protein KF729_36120 [Sandaracinaceae bacterium]|nr:hypothetical protein [Sandaracinaceae bacterium]